MTQHPTSRIYVDGEPTVDFVAVFQQAPPGTIKLLNGVYQYLIKTTSIPVQKSSFPYTLCLPQQDLVAELRAAIRAVMVADNVGVNALARRMHVHPSSVSVMLSNKRDLNISTVILMLHALGYTIKLDLVRSSFEPSTEQP